MTNKKNAKPKRLRILRSFLFFLCPHFIFTDKKSFLSALKCIAFFGVQCSSAYADFRLPENCKGEKKMRCSLGNFAPNSSHYSSLCLLSKRTILFFSSFQAALSHLIMTIISNHASIWSKRIPKMPHLLQSNPHCSTETAGRTERQLLQDEQVGLRARSPEYNRIISRWLKPDASVAIVMSPLQP